MACLEIKADYSAHGTTSIKSSYKKTLFSSKFYIFDIAIHFTSFNPFSER